MYVHVKIRKNANEFLSKLFDKTYINKVELQSLLFGSMAIMLTSY